MSGITQHLAEDRVQLCPRDGSVRRETDIRRLYIRRAVVSTPARGRARRRSTTFDDGRWLVV
jgi:hypothetical protein